MQELTVICDKCGTKMKQQQKHEDPPIICLLTVQIIGEKREYDLCSKCALEIQTGLKEPRITVAVV